MDDIVADALAEHDREAEASDTAAFGSPSVLYVGCGVAGARRVRAHTSSPDRDCELRTRVLTDDDWSGKLSVADDAELRILTLDLGDDGAVETATDVAATAPDTPTVILATCPAAPTDGLPNELGETAATLLPIDATLADADESVTGYVDAIVDVFSRSLAFPVDIATAYTLWSGSGVAVPFTGDVTFDIGADAEPFEPGAVQSALSPAYEGCGLDMTNREPVGWFAHAVVPPSFQLRGAYELEALLPGVLGATDTAGVLAGRVTDASEASRSLTLRCLRVIE